MAKYVILLGETAPERLPGWRGHRPDRLQGVVRYHAVEVAMIRASIWYLGIAIWGIAIWAALSIWFCARVLRL